MRDSQRALLYAAEGSMREWGRVEFRTVAEMQDYLDRLTGSRWFQSRWGQRRIAVHPGHGHRHAAGGSGIVRLPHWARGQIVLLHEVAHNLVPNRYADHGPEFAGVLLALVRKAMGVPAGRRLRKAFLAHGVSVSFRAVPAAGSRQVVAKTEMAAREGRADWPVSASERERAAAIIRRAARQGMFGPSGRKSRAHALATARCLER